MIEQDSGESSVPTAVLDTNTVLDMLLFDDPAARPLRDAVAGGSLRWIATVRMLEELRGVLLRSRMGRWQPPAHAAQTLAWATKWMQQQPAPPAGTAPRCRDTADQPFIDLAWATGECWLLSRDKALLKLARHARMRGVRICTPATWRGGAATHPGGKDRVLTS